MINLFIGIGGTGQHAALAITRLIRLGALPPMKGRIIDAEDKSNLATRLQTYTVSNLLPHPLEGADTFYPPFDKDKLGEAGVFQDLFLARHAPPEERELFELFFPAEDAGLNLNQGMYGRPSVGATVLTYSMRGALSEIFRSVSMENSVYVAGSFIGGTGAGITHRLIAGLTHEKPGIKVFGTFYLPWIKMPEKADEGAITNHLLDCNMRHGLEYFSVETLRHVKGAVLIGVPKDAEADPLVGKAEVKKGEVGELPHVFHLIAAYGILKMDELGVSDQVNHAVYSFSCDSGDPHWLYRQKWYQPAGFTHEPTLRDYYYKGYFLALLYRWLESEHMQKEIRNAFKWYGSAKAIGEGLKATIENHAPDKNDRENLIANLAKSWNARRLQLERAYRYLEKTIKPPSDPPAFITALSDEETAGGLSALRLAAVRDALGKGIQRSGKTAKTKDLADAIEERLAEVFWNRLTKG